MHPVQRIERSLTSDTVFIFVMRNRSTGMYRDRRATDAQLRRFKRHVTRQTGISWRLINPYRQPELSL